MTMRSPKSWVSSFKKVFSSLLKSVANFEEGGCLVPSKEGSNPVLAGLADIDLAPFSSSVGGNVPEPKKAEKDTAAVFDESVNGKITCKFRRMLPGTHFFCIIAHNSCILDRQTW